MTAGLAEFLLARVAEEEEIARKAAAAPMWQHSDFARQVAGRTGPLWTVSAASAFGRDLGARGSVEARPGRVLAECEAKRRIVELHAVSVASEWVNPPDGPAYQEPERTCAICGWVPDACDTVKALALPYADHQDYRQEWRP